MLDNKELKELEDEEKIFGESYDSEIDNDEISEDPSEINV